MNGGVQLGAVAISKEKAEAPKVNVLVVAVVCYQRYPGCPCIPRNSTTPSLSVTTAESKPSTLPGENKKSNKLLAASFGVSGN